MTKIKKVLFVCMGVFLFTSLSLVQAQNATEPQEAPSKPHLGQRIQEIYSQLNLTDDQKKQLEANKQQHRARMESARTAMKVNKEAIQAELMKPQLDMVKINQIYSQIKALQSQMEDDKLSSILAVRSILTPDQFTKFVTLMHRHKPEGDHR